MPVIEIARHDLRISRLPAAAARTADANKARRILAIAMGRDGHARGRAGRDRQTPRDWAKPAKGSSWRSRLEWLAEGIRANADGACGPAPASASAASGRSPIERSGEVGGRRP